MAQNNATSGNYPLIRYSSPASLQVLASAKIATNLWRHKIDDLDMRDKAVPWSWIDEGRTHLLPVPSAISGLIENALKVMLKRILAWVQYYSRTVFQWREERDVVTQIFYDVEVDDDDVITAKRLLSCDRVTPEEKYKIACVFCLEECVVRLWPLVEGNTRISEVTFKENKMIYYWNCMMKEVPVEVPGNANDSINLRMISQYFLRYPSVMHFLRKLTNEERISFVDRVFTLDIQYGKIVTNLLPQLNHIEARRILENFAIKIISTLARNSCMEYVVQVWTYFCQFASAHQELEVLSNLYTLAYLMRYPFAQELPKYESYRVSEVLYELWTRSPDSLKTYVTDNFVEYAFENLNDVDMIVGDLPELYGRDMRFLLELLGRVDLKTRNRLWCENWLQLIIIAKPEYLDQFMKLCFETDEQIIRFKEGKMMDYDEVDIELQTFVYCELFDELSELIRFCSSDPTRIENLRRRIIAYHFSFDLLLNQKKCQNFVKFIDDTFESVEQAGLFKEEFLTSSHEYEMLKQVYANLDKGCIKNMINIRHFLYSKTRTDAIKQECLSHCKQCLVETKFMNFDVNDWKTFTLWCCETRSNWWAFRRSLPVNQIFEKLLTKVIKGHVRLEGQGVNKAEVRYSEINNPTYEMLLSFVPVDNFLLWLYVKQDIANKYKEAKLKNWSSKVILRILGKNWATIVDVLLMWFLNGDKRRVEEFKASFGSDASTSAEA